MPPIRVHLSPPHMEPADMAMVQAAFTSNWIAPSGPDLDAFEKEFAAKVGARHATAVSSGTAALHLALKVTGIQPGDEVICSTLTFVASANPIRYLGATPIFIDSDRETWNLNPALLAEFLEKRARIGRIPRALVLVHLYGQSADIKPIKELCDRYGVIIVEDAAEALGATYHGKTPGTFGRCGIFSFNGNKIITTSGGGMLVSDDPILVQQAKFLATQARDHEEYYQHSQIGYNYRLSNILAALGRSQLRVLDARVAARRETFARYQELLDGIDGLEFMPEASFGRSSRWLVCVLIDPVRFGMNHESVRLALGAENIEARSVWKPMHMQPLYEGCERIGGAVAEQLFDQGLCLPSGSNLPMYDLERVVAVVRRCAGRV
ncbi:pyridoxal phosphate-dependent aminotransferase [Verrucomicrobia bacterium IMCC26134]|nr:pyridoxal phosphate-dependent aminotransferase [Verrucomicrobia bacterium IMCC26134]